MRVARDRTEKSFETLQLKVQELTEFKSRVEGGAIPDRLAKVEAGQRADETALVRVEERLSSINSLLGTLCEEIRE